MQLAEKFRLENSDGQTLKVVPAVKIFLSLGTYLADSVWSKMHIFVRNIVFNQGVANFAFSLSQNQILIIIAHAVDRNVQQLFWLTYRTQIKMRLQSNYA